MLLLLCGWCAGQGGTSPQFEVASIKPAGDGPARESFSGGPGSGDPERATWVNVSPQSLIEAAYLVEPYQVSGPAWLRTDRYSVTVKIPPGSSRSQFRQMVANLLAERFSLVFHRVTRTFAAYELTLAPGRQLKLSPSPAKEGGVSQFRRIRTAQGLMHYTFTQTSMETLADDLRLMIPRRTPGAPLDLRPVMDRTEIAGRFDFELDVAETDETADNFGALSEALASQLAVKLSRTKADLEVLVIDRVERAPTAN